MSRATAATRSRTALGFHDADDHELTLVDETEPIKEVKTSLFSPANNRENLAIAVSHRLRSQH